MATSAAGRLDPVGRLRLPRRPTLLRAVLVAVLLVTAAGVLHATGSQPERATAPAGPADPAAAPAEPVAAPAGPDPAQGEPDPATAATGQPPDRLPIPAGQVGVPVPLGDPARLAVLRPGDRVDLLAVPADGGEPVPLATAAPVLAVDHAAATLLLAISPAQARRVLSTPPATSTFAVIIRSWPGPG